jgi:hypothetical protein|nr:MAG TPA: hypothetical protein [Caudoviricetes sp.]
MKRIAVAIEVADENLCAQELRADVEDEYGVRIVLNSNYADKTILIVPEPVRVGGDEILPPVRIDALKAALASLGVAVATPSSLSDALLSGAEQDNISARKRLRLMFREFKSNPLSSVDLRGKDPADPSKLARKRRAKRFKEDFYASLSEFIAANPGLSYKDYWDADRRPYEKQWPEYRAAVKRAKDIRGRE